ncbi:MAG: hypothetical protein ACETWQ_04425 [Phycisphaerae bacterium]
MAETASNGRFILNSLLAMTYASLEASIFSDCYHICVEFSLKIVYNRMGDIKEGGCIFKFCSSVAKLGYSA